MLEKKLIKKILLITLSNIGDAVMTIPTLVYMHNKYPKAKFDLVCDEKSKEIFMNFPYVNQILIKKKNLGLKILIKWILYLRKEKYDLAIDLRTDILLYFLRADKKFFKVNNKNIHSVLKHLKSVDKNLSSTPMFEFYIPPSLFRRIEKYFLNIEGKSLALALGAKSLHKIWPTQYYITLINSLKKYFNHIVIVGDLKDVDRAKEFINKCDINVTNLCGVLNLNETAAAIYKSDYFIGNDSGLGHLASALKKPTFTIFGAGNPQRYRPWGENCFWYQNDDKDINTIEPELILKKIKKAFNFN